MRSWALLHLFDHIILVKATHLTLLTGEEWSPDRDTLQKKNKNQKRNKKIADCDIRIYLFLIKNTSMWVRLAIRSGHWQGDGGCAEVKNSRERDIGHHYFYYVYNAVPVRRIESASCVCHNQWTMTEEVPTTTTLDEERQVTKKRIEEVHDAPNSDSTPTSHSTNTSTAGTSKGDEEVPPQESPPPSRQSLRSRGKDEEFPIHRAVKKGDVARFQKLLGKRKLATGSHDINERTRSGATFYTTAAAHGFVTLYESVTIFSCCCLVSEWSSTHTRSR